jgi:large subunit ribosomal protein L19
MNTTTKETSLRRGPSKLANRDLIKLIEQKHFSPVDSSNEVKDTLKPGDIIRLGYKIPEGDKERLQYYEGLIIAIQNRTLSKTIKMRRTVQGIGIEQTFVLNSPKIASITKKQSSKVRRAKLYFIRDLKGKATRLKVKR